MPPSRAQQQQPSSFGRPSTAPQQSTMAAVAANPAAAAGAHLFPMASPAMPFFANPAAATAAAGMAAFPRAMWPPMAMPFAMPPQLYPGFAPGMVPDNSYAAAMMHQYAQSVQKSMAGASDYTAHIMSGCGLPQTAGFPMPSNTNTSTVSAANALTAAQNSSNTDPSSPATIVAERFKTQPCKNFKLKGVCPYESRCMFAHGDDELRTKEQNVADGLTTEEAVKTHQRRIAAASKRAAKKGQQFASPSGKEAIVQEPTSALSAIAGGPYSPASGSQTLHVGERELPSLDSHDGVPLPAMNGETATAVAQAQATTPQGVEQEPTSPEKAKRVVSETRKAYLRAKKKRKLKRRAERRRAERNGEVVNSDDDSSSDSDDGELPTDPLTKEVDDRALHRRRRLKTLLECSPGLGPEGADQSVETCVDSTLGEIAPSSRLMQTAAPQSVVVQLRDMQAPAHRNNVARNTGADSLASVSDGANASSHGAILPHSAPVVAVPAPAALTTVTVGRGLLPAVASNVIPTGVSPSAGRGMTMDTPHSAPTYQHHPYSQIGRGHDDIASNNTSQIGMNNPRVNQTPNTAAMPLGPLSGIPAETSPMHVAHRNQTPHGSCMSPSNNTQPPPSGGLLASFMGRPQSRGMYANQAPQQFHPMPRAQAEELNGSFNVSAPSAAAVLAGSHLGSRPATSNAVHTNMASPASGVHRYPSHRGHGGGLSNLATHGAFPIQQAQGLYASMNGVSFNEVPSLLASMQEMENPNIDMRANHNLNGSLNVHLPPQQPAIGGHSQDDYSTGLGPGGNYTRRPMSSAAAVPNATGSGYYPGAELNMRAAGYVSFTPKPQRHESPPRVSGDDRPRGKTVAV